MYIYENLARKAVLYFSVIIVLICRYCCVFTNRMYFLLVCKIVVCMITPLVYHKTFRDVVIKMYVIIKKFYFPWICGCLYFKYGIYSEVNNILRRQIKFNETCISHFYFPSMKTDFDQDNVYNSTKNAKHLNAQTCKQVLSSKKKFYTCDKTCWNRRPFIIHHKH